MLYSSKIEAQRQNHFPAFNQTGDGAGFMALFWDEQDMALQGLKKILLYMPFAFNGICGGKE